MVQRTIFAVSVLSVVSTAPALADPTAAATAPPLSPAILAATRPMDPATLERPTPDRSGLSATVRLAPPAAPAAGFAARDAGDDGGRLGPSLELNLAASGRRTGLGLDVGFAQRAALLPRSQDQGERRGAELRVGRGLERLVQPYEDKPTWENPSWYFFAASEDQALTWTPADRAGFSAAEGLRLQTNRVEIGDMQTGVAIQAHGVQASLSYVEREISYKSGSASDNFAGLTITVRR